METLSVHCDLEQDGFRLREGESPRDALHVTYDLEIGRMPSGTAGGEATVMLKGRAGGDAGELVIFETTLRLLRTAIMAFDAYVDGRN